MVAGVSLPWSSIATILSERTTCFISSRRSSCFLAAGVVGTWALAFRWAAHSARANAVNAKARWGLRTNCGFIAIGLLVSRGGSGRPSRQADAPAPDPLDREQADQQHQD